MLHHPRGKKKIFRISNLNLSSKTITPCLITALPDRVPPQLSCRPPLGAGRPLYGLPKSGVQAKLCGEEVLAQDLERKKDENPQRRGKPVHHWVRGQSKNHRKWERFQKGHQPYHSSLTQLCSCYLSQSLSCHSSLIASGTARTFVKTG